MGWLEGWRRALSDLCSCSSRARKVLKDQLVEMVSRAQWDCQVQQVLLALLERMETRWELVAAVQGHSGKDLGSVPHCHCAACAVLGRLVVTPGVFHGACNPRRATVGRLGWAGSASQATC